MTTMVIFASAAVVFVFILGYVVGYMVGEADGVASHAERTRARRCAHD